MSQELASLDLEEILKIDPVVLEQLLQEEPHQQKLVNVDNQTIASQSWRVLRQLFLRNKEEILQPKPYERPKKENKTMDRKVEEVLRRFDPFSEQLVRATFSKYDKDTANIVDGEKEMGEENGRRYIRWRYSRWLEISVASRARRPLKKGIKSHIV